MARYLDPKNDFAFKKIFGHHPDLLKSFLNAVLPLPDGCIIESLNYLVSEGVPELENFKNSIVDVRCKDNHGRYFIVEMQMQWIKDFVRRMLYNTTSTYVRQLKKGESYQNLTQIFHHSRDEKAAKTDEARQAQNYDESCMSTYCPRSNSSLTQQSSGFPALVVERDEISGLSPVYGLALINAKFEEGEEWFHHFKMTHAIHGEKTLDDIQLVLIELPKLKPSTITEKKLAILWLRFLKEINEKTQEVDPHLLEIAEIKEAVTLLEISSYNESELLEYDKRWDFVSSQKTLITGKYEQGRSEGKAEGLAEGLAKGLAEGERKTKVEMMRNFHQLGVSIEQIVQAAKLSQKEAEKMLRD